MALHAAKLVTVYMIKFQKPCSGSTKLDARSKPKMSASGLINACTRLMVDGTLGQQTTLELVGGKARQVEEWQGLRVKWVTYHVQRRAKKKSRAVLQ